MRAFWASNLFAEDSLALEIGELYPLE